MSARAFMLAPRDRPAGGRMLSMTGQGSKAPQFFTDVDAVLPDGSLDLQMLGRVAEQHAVKIG